LPTRSRRRPRIHICGLLERVVAIDIRRDRSVAVDASTKEVSEIIVGNGERTERQALRGREADAREPFVESPIAPLQPHVPGTRMSRNPVCEAEATFERFEKLYVLRGDRDMAPVGGQVSIRSDQAYGISEPGRPRGRGRRKVQYMSATVHIRSTRPCGNRETSQAPSDRRGIALKSCSDLGHGQVLIDEEPFQADLVDRYVGRPGSSTSRGGIARVNVHNLRL
jgi:hypothetical protein